MRRVKERVPIEQCVRRALACLDRESPKTAATVAQAIWPDAEWRAAQGAGAAASRVLKRMVADKKAQWVCRDGNWGYIRTDWIS